MSATPGKVLVVGTTQIEDEAAFVLKMIQGRDPSWVNRVFFARFDAQATWLTGLRPLKGRSEFFFEPYLRAMAQGGWQPSWAEDDELTA
jgi:hypothetical protein